MQENKKRFIELAIRYQVLRFGEFTLKSGRISPYFFNAGLFNSGYALAELGSCYAQTIIDNNIDYDVLFGPAYKGCTWDPVPVINLKSHLALHQCCNHQVHSIFGPEFIIPVVNLSWQVGGVHIDINGFVAYDLHDPVHQLVHEVLGIAHFGLLLDPESQPFPIVVGPGHGIGKGIIEAFTALIAK